MPSARPPVVAARPPAGAPAGDAEWLLTDGGGGYACGCADDRPRRRYHGLWLVRKAGQTRRHMAVAALDERVLHAGAVHYLMHVHWRDQPEPTPPGAAVAFVHRPLPTWTFRIGDLVLERTVALGPATEGRGPALLVRWRNRSTVAVRLDVRPLLGYCDADQLPAADSGFLGEVTPRGASWGCQPSPVLDPLWLTADGVAAFRADAAWYRGFLFATDRERGYDHVGDRWTPGVLELELGAGRDATIAFALGEPCGAAGDAFDRVERTAAVRWAEVAASGDPMPARLAYGADDFFYRADGGRLGVLAGFPWFAEWGRDAFVSLPGLTLSRGRRDLCAEVLRGALPFLRRGLLPNVYGRDPAHSHYDSCDAALWFALAVARFADAGGDRACVEQELVPALVGIARSYQQGTELGLLVEPSGLLAAGREDLNATWMDARTAAGPVTPRAGLPVEIQALWYSLLAFLAERDGKQWQAARDRCGGAFVAQFWLAAGDFLADRVHGGVPDRTVRPNMVIAAALPRSPLTMAQRAAVVHKARGELVTPVGLRTLSPLDRAYRARYEGGPEARDSAYHQGTVWPWLGGFYVEAALAAVGKPARRNEAQALRNWLDGLLPELDRAGLDHVSEVFDGDPPHRPGGTFAQAWNTGELLRALALLAEAGS